MAESPFRYFKNQLQKNTYAIFIPLFRHEMNKYAARDNFPKRENRVEINAMRYFQDTIPFKLPLFGIALQGPFNRYVDIVRLEVKKAIESFVQNKMMHSPIRES